VVSGERPGDFVQRFLRFRAHVWDDVLDQLEFRKGSRFQQRRFSAKRELRKEIALLSA
jgi:hypothetical protein